MRPKKTIIIVGSHHTPAIELIHQLQSDTKTSWEIHYLAHISPSETHLTHTIIPKLKISFHPIDSGKFDRRFPSKTIKGIPLTISGIFKSLSLIKQLKPDIVVSFGAYVSVPVIIAAKIIGVKSIIHEQTLTNSLTTKICAPLVNKIALSFDHQPQINELPSKKVVITGNLLRREIFQNSSPKFSNLSKLPLIYVTGGNQGSSVINETILKALPSLSNFFIVHQTGPLDIQKYLPLKKKNYFPVEYVDSSDIGWIYHQATVIVSRSGANTCQEIAALQKKSILIPFPYAQQNEQLLNAQWLQRQLPNTTKIIDQSQISPQKIVDDIDYLVKLSPSKATVEDSPNQKLLDLIYELV